MICVESSDTVHYTLRLEYKAYTMHMLRLEHKAINTESAYTLHYMARPEYKKTRMVLFSSPPIHDEECNGSNSVHCLQDDNSNEILAEIINRVSRITNYIDKWRTRKVVTSPVYPLYNKSYMDD